MGDVTVIGLGSMGSALARTLVNAEKSVCVWTRDRQKVADLEDVGATGAVSVEQAILASQVILICINDYASTRTLLDQSATSGSLAGKVIVQLSTGKPQEARAAGAWFRDHEADYLDGAILCGPNAIGTSGATLLFSGVQRAFDRARMLLEVLAPDSRYLGEKDGMASALDLAWLTQLYGSYVGAAHGVVLCESEGVDLDAYSAVLNESDASRWLVEVINNGDFRHPTATLAVWNAALARIVEHASEAKINGEFPRFVAGVLNRAESEGLGQEEIGAMVKVLRKPTRGL